MLKLKKKLIELGISVSTLMTSLIIAIIKGLTSFCSLVEVVGLILLILCTLNGVDRLYQLYLCESSEGVDYCVTAYTPIYEVEVIE